MADPSGGVWAWIVANYQGLLVAQQGAIVLGAAVGLGLAAWRIRVANRQAKAAENATEVALQQVELSREGFIERQFQAGVELFGNVNVTIRLGGIFALTNLMQRYPDAYHTSVMRLFVAFLAHRLPCLPDTKVVDLSSLDLINIVEVINETGEEERAIEELDHFDLERSLRGTFFAFRAGKVVLSDPSLAAHAEPDSVWR